MQQAQQSNSVPKVSTVDIKQEGLVHDTQYDYYGKRLAICSSDGLVQIYDVTKSDGIYNVASFKASEKGPVWQVAWAHPRFGNIIATCSYDKKVIIWKEQKPNEWVELVKYENIHQGSVNSIAWAPAEHGLKLAASSSDGIVGIYSLRQSDDTWNSPVQWEAHSSGINGVSWQPMNSINISLEQNNDYKWRLATVSCDKTVVIWELDQNNKHSKVLTLEGHQDWVRDVAWSPSINSYQLIATCSEDKTVKLWKISDQGDSMQLQDTITLEVGFPAWRVSWSLTGSMLAVSTASPSQDGSVLIFKEDENGNWNEIQNCVDLNDNNKNQN